MKIENNISKLKIILIQFFLYRLFHSEKFFFLGTLAFNSTRISLNYVLLLRVNIIAMATEKKVKTSFTMHSYNFCKSFSFLSGYFYSLKSNNVVLFLVLTFHSSHNFSLRGKINLFLSQV